MNAQIIRKMMTANTTPKTIFSLLMVFGLTISANTHAAKSDLAQEITIKSQRQSADLKNKIASYHEKVSIQQGSISITADIVKVYSTTNDSTGEKQETYWAQGKPATFQQALEDGSLILLQAEEVTYLPTLNTITISGNAVVKQAGSEVSGNEISYNLLTEQLEAKSTDNQSVTTVLRPTVLKKQKAAHDQSKAEKALDNTDTDKGNNSDN